MKFPKKIHSKKNHSNIIQTLIEIIIVIIIEIIIETIEIIIIETIVIIIEIQECFKFPFLMIIIIDTAQCDITFKIQISAEKMI